MRRFLSYIFYLMLRFELATQELLSCPLVCLLRKERVRAWYGRRGVADPERVVTDAVQRSGINQTIAETHFVLIVWMALFGVVNLLLWLLRAPVEYSLAHFLAIGALAFALSHGTVLRASRYQRDFDEFDTMPRRTRRAWTFLAFLAYLCTLGLGIASFTL